VSTANGKNGQAGPLSADELRGLRPLTAGDFYYGHKKADRLPDGGDDPQDLMFHAVHHAAVRAGIAESDDLFGFLDRIELDVVSAIFSDDLTESEPAGPLATTPTTS
jgi:hypothetical protein